jgi:hypothetical protein
MTLLVLLKQLWRSDACSVGHHASQPNRAMTHILAKRSGSIPAGAAEYSHRTVWLLSVHGLGNADLTGVRMPLSVRLWLGSKHLGSVVL